jgi:hypothetical protein
MEATPSPTSPLPTAPEEERDCLSCRLISSITCAGVSGWLLQERGRLPVAKVGDRRVLAVMGGTFGVLAAMRAIGFPWRTGGSLGDS